MKREAEQVLCRFHLSNLAHRRDEPLYQWIVETAHHLGLRGATVLKGFMGLKSDGALVGEKRWSLAHEVPTIVEVVDEASQIERLLKAVEPAFHEGLITLERAHVLIYRSGKDPGPRIGEGVAVLDSKAESAAKEVSTMKLPEEGVLLRIFIGEADREPSTGRPLYEAIVRRAREAHLAGATVLKGPLGFGKNSRVHAANLLELSSDLPIVIEVVDSEERLNAFLPTVDELVTEGLVTLEAVRVLKYVAAPKAP